MTGPATPGSRELQEPDRRLFFALWPEPATLEVLVAAMSRMAPPGVGRAQRRDQLHLTLEFLGSVPESRLSTVLGAGAAVARCAGPLQIVFDRLEYWRRSQVLCLTATVTPDPLATLVRSLRAELLACGFEPEKRPFTAHLTLARKVRRPPRLPAVEPLAWPAREFSLVESNMDRAGSHYERIATWPLAA